MVVRVLVWPRANIFPHSFDGVHRVMTRPFERHDRFMRRPRPSWNRQATIEGRPAWQVVQERSQNTKDNA